MPKKKCWNSLVKEIQRILLVSHASVFEISEIVKYRS